jgi:hypothetical protein
VISSRDWIKTEQGFHDETHDGVMVAQKAKVIEVDSRGEQSKITGIAERPRRIVLGVLEAIKQKDSQ